MEDKLAQANAEIQGQVERIEEMDKEMYQLRLAAGPTADTLIKMQNQACESPTVHSFMDQRYFLSRCRARHVTPPHDMTEEEDFIP